MNNSTTCLSRKWCRFLDRGKAKNKQTKIKKTLIGVKTEEMKNRLTGLKKEKIKNRLTGFKTEDIKQQKDSILPERKS